MPFTRKVFLEIKLFVIIRRSRGAEVAPDAPARPGACGAAAVAMIARRGPGSPPGSRPRPGLPGPPLSEVPRHYLRCHGRRYRPAPLPAETARRLIPGPPAHTLGAACRGRRYRPAGATASWRP